MVSLRVLNAGSNELDTVTESIGLLLHTGMLVKLLLFFYFSGRLARLSQLQLQHNNIKSVPSAIYNLVVPSIIHLHGSTKIVIDCDLQSSATDAKFILMMHQNPSSCSISWEVQVFICSVECHENHSIFRRSMETCLYCQVLFVIVRLGESDLKKGHESIMALSF